LAASYADIAATGAGLVADQAAERKADKYADFTASQAYCGGKPRAPECFSAGVHQQSGSKN